MSFTHLHVRSGYNLMESTNTIDKLVKRASELNFSALALTDEHVLYGAIEFYKACQKYGIKPIIGMTVNVVNNELEEQCILLAKDNLGYKQLIEMSTYINQSKQTSIDIKEFNLYTGNLICILRVANGQLGSLLIDNSQAEAQNFVEEWYKMFAREDFYLSVEDHGHSRERRLHEPLKTFSKQYDIAVVAVNDVRYINKDDYLAYDCLHSMKNGNSWSIEHVQPHVKQRHLRSKTEMNEVFSSAFPDSLQRTVEIRDKCTVSFDFKQRLLPSFPVPDTYQSGTYLREICWRNVEKRYDNVTKEVSERLTYELEVIHSMGFNDYFLIVWDFITYAKNNDISVGPGRGSAAGSIVAYVLGITDVDPILYDLLFERFLNPERVTMPDIDVDFSDYRRDEVIDYVREKYGEKHVAQIITFGTFGVRSLLRELIKTMGIDDNDSRFILSQTSEKTIKQFVTGSEDLKEYIKQSKRLQTLFKIAIKLEGLPRHISTHAAGVIISEQPLIEHVPLTFGSSETTITQYPMNDLEAIGLLKIDFLGLRNLTLLERIMNSITTFTNKQVSLNTIPIDDKKTYKLLQAGNTNGVFQLESRGMKQVLTRLKPTTFEDIVAVNALFRPGPMEHIPTYIARKHNKQKVSYLHSDLKPILEPTYGVLIYQEQMMQIVHKFAGLSLGEADVLRRIISSQQTTGTTEQQLRFINGCIKKGYDETVAKNLFDFIVESSKYGFNRSHAVAYSRIAYELAYLKANYPACFFAELLSTVANQWDKVYLYINEAKDLQLNIAPPSINKSIGKYTVGHKGEVRMGLLSIKGIGFQTIKEIIHARKPGPFKDLFDFCLRVSLKKINRSTIELLIMAGAFDETYKNRASLLASIDQAMDQGILFKEFTDQASLLQDQVNLVAQYTDIEDFSEVKKLTDEKELLGIYVSSHPLKRYRKKITEANYVLIDKAKNFLGKRNIYVIAIIQSIKTIRTKRGDPMAFIILGDESGDIDAVIFPELFRKTKFYLEEEVFVEVSGKVEQRNDRIQYVVDQIKLFDKRVFIKSKQRLFIKITTQSSAQAIKAIHSISFDHKGNTPIIVYDEKRKRTYQLSKVYNINPTDTSVKKLKNHFGEKCVVLEDG